MATENPFYVWSIVEAWDWLIHIPVAGFVLLVVLGLLVLGVFLAINALFSN